MDITHYMSDDNKMNKIQIEGGKRKTKKRTKKLYKRSQRKYKKCNIFWGITFSGVSPCFFQNIKHATFFGYHCVFFFKI